MKPAVRLEMPNTDRVIAVLAEGIRRFAPQVVVESGTFLGTGSTRIIIRAFAGKLPPKFYSIEVSDQLRRRAMENLSDTPVVECLWGLSIGKEHAREFLLNDPLLKELDPNLDIYVDFLPDPVGGYLKELDGSMGGEIQGACPERLLEQLLEKHRQDRPLICLDSAGGIGWLEFQEVLRLQAEYPFLLFLDDINHVKHYRSKVYVETTPGFEVIGSDLEEGWVVALFSGNC